MSQSAASENEREGEAGWWADPGAGCAPGDLPGSEGAGLSLRLLTCFLPFVEWVVSTPHRGIAETK